jgi:hypothetical protein
MMGSRRNSTVWVADETASTAEAVDLAARAVALEPENATIPATAAWAYSTLGVRFESRWNLRTALSRFTRTQSTFAQSADGIQLLWREHQSDRAVRGSTPAKPNTVQIVWG